MCEPTKKLIKKKNYNKKVKGCVNVESDNFEKEDNKGEPDRRVTIEQK
jgi:hypothetical protein